MDDQAFSRQIEERYPTLLRTAYLILGGKDEAKDAVQDALIRAWRFRSSLLEDKKINAWLHRVVVTSCYSQLRREIPHRDRRTVDSVLEQRPDDHPSPEDASATSAASAALLDAIRSLPANFKIPLVLRYYAELSIEEISVAIGCRPGTVKSRLHEARRRLALEPKLKLLVSTNEIKDRQSPKEVVQ